MQVQATVYHLNLGTQTDTQFVVGIVVAHAKGGTALLYQTVEEGVEDKVGVPLVVAHLSTKGEVLGTLGNAEVDSVETDIAHGERMDIAIAVQATLGRRRHVEEQRLEIDVLSCL